MRSFTLRAVVGVSLAAALAAGGDDATMRWVTSDPHVHSSGCLERRSPAELADLLARQGLEVSSVLVWGDGYANDRPYFTAADHPASRPGHILHYDLEVSAFPAGLTGHLILLGLRSLDFSDRPFETPRSGVPIVDWARAQDDRVLVGMAHGQTWPADGHFPTPEENCCIPFELPVHVARDRLSFLVTERRGHGPAVDEGTFFLWKRLLNAGFRVALAGGSDLPCLRVALDVATPRTDVLVQGPLSYEGWLDGIRKGRTVVVARDENRLDLRVNGTPVGSEVRVAAGDPVLVSVASSLTHDGRIDILVNGVPATTLFAQHGTHVATVPLTASSSFWVAARAPYGATSAVYVIVDGKPIRASAADACYLARYVDHLTALVEDGRLPLGESREVALAAYREARVELTRRFVEAGGQTCR